MIVTFLLGVLAWLLFRWIISRWGTSLAIWWVHFLCKCFKHPLAVPHEHVSRWGMWNRPVTMQTWTTCRCGARASGVSEHAVNYESEGTVH